MRSLFSKIFLWFWLAQALVGGVLVLVTVATWPRPRETGWQDVTRDTLNLHARIVATLLARQGPRGLKPLLDGTELQGMHLGVFDVKGREITGHALPSQVRQTAMRYLAATPYPSNRTFEDLEPAMVQQGNAVLAAVWLPAEAGKRLVLAGELPRIEVRSWGKPAPLMATTLRDAIWPFYRTASFQVITTAPPPDVLFYGTQGPLSGKVVGRVTSDPVRTIPPVGGMAGIQTSSGMKPPGMGTTAMAFTAGPPEMENARWILPLRLLTVLLTAGLVCYGLALYLTAPARTLRSATRRLAEGDLSARVGPAMGRRRDELADLGRDFDSMASRLESLVLSERRLLADISHELRSPLTRLQVALELARQDSAPKAQPSLNRIEDEADRLNALIAQLLTLTRLENGLPGGASRPVDFESLLRRVSTDAHFEAVAHGKTVILQETAPLWTAGDGDLLHRAVENVVRNAVRYTAPGTAVDLEADEVETPEGLYVRIRVRDQGPGVPEAELEEIFRPFYRVNPAREAASGGLGLGLSITERAVRLHGGRVEAANAQEGGLVVEIYLPAVREEQAPTQLLAQFSVGQNGEDFAFPFPRRLSVGNEIRED